MKVPTTPLAAVASGESPFCIDLSEESPAALLSFGEDRSTGVGNHTAFSGERTEETLLHDTRGSSDFEACLASPTLQV